MGEEVGHEAGPSRNWWTAEEESPLRDGVMDLDDSPSKSMLQGTNKGHQRKVSSLDIQSSNSESNTEEEIFKYWATEDVRKQNMKILHSATDSTLVEEAMRYGSVSLWKGERVPGSSHLIPFLFDRAPEGSITIVQDLSGRGLSLRGAEWSSGLNNPHAVRGEKEDRWEESDLAKFSLFLGFSTEGLEEEILDFLLKSGKEGREFMGREGSRETLHRVKGVKLQWLMKLKLLSWNVWGANEKVKRKIIKSFIRNQRVDLMCIQETKIHQMSEGVVRSLGSGRFLDWRALDTNGTAGGILICWDKRTLEILEWEEGQFSLSCRFRNVENGTVWVFTRVYGPFTKEERECLWEEIGAIRGLWEDPWCVGGDYNITLFQRERSRQGRITSAMRRFAQIVDEVGLMDIPLQGGVFTWSGGPNNQSWARLDRFLVNSSWLDQFSGVFQRRLPRPLSDHFPVLLEGGGLRRGSASFRLATKLKEIKQRLKVWNKEVFGNLGCNKAAALQQVEFWDLVERDRILSMEEMELKKEAKENYKKWVLLEETHWRQLSREIWLREGDRNTGYFHRMANAKRRNNYLDRIKIDGVCISEEQEMREGIANAYQQMLSEESGWQADIEG
ncbi:hypothetical protein CK203_039968 [Vitis vinifera]|uniref:Endonuclease/exonuclease/phosphatase domain-containing protein n=1 Tax=Vitis vinifera TaxID=29760 RepID=A0A438I301_VITVI|nr:hypothetical protein CK203_039968 [Vitis vinifera]